MLKVGTICVIPVKVGPITPADIYPLKFNDRNTRARCERC